MTKTESEIMSMLLGGNSYPLYNRRTAKTGVRLWRELPYSTHLYSHEGTIYLRAGNAPAAGQILLAGQLADKHKFGEYAKNTN